MKPKPIDFFNVLAYSKNSEAKKLIKSVCARSNVTFVDSKDKTDLKSTDFKIAFIDADFFYDVNTGILDELAQFKKLGDRQVVILGGKPENLPVPLSLYCKGLVNIDDVAISKIIDKQLLKNKLQPSAKNKEEILKKRILRIVYLYHSINQSPIIYKEEVCEKFGISERTLFRDLKVLKELFPEQWFYLEKKRL